MNETANNQQEMKMKAKYICAHCGKTDAKHIKALMDAGFGEKQIMCMNCGQNAIKENIDEKYNPKAY
jgi:DNA-directed RNA polymerase subunit RPC12/RpoP